MKTRPGEVFRKMQRAEVGQARAEAMANTNNLVASGRLTSKQIMGEIESALRTAHGLLQIVHTSAHPESLPNIMRRVHDEAYFASGLAKYLSK